VRSKAWQTRIVAFTVFELLIIVVIIGILAAFLFPAFAGLRARAQRVQCTVNLRSLYVAANLYVQQNGSWPQISVSDSDDDQAYVQAWIAALAPFGPAQKSWICPTVESLLGSPDLSNSSNARLDYIPMPFDDKPTTPYQWPRQPWFVEANDVHGHGNLIIFTDGSISDLKTVAANASPAPSASH